MARPAAINVDVSRAAYLPLSTRRMSSRHALSRA
jgi:hypothetical protein